MLINHGGKVKRAVQTSMMRSADTSLVPRESDKDIDQTSESYRQFTTHDSPANGTNF